MTQIFIIFFAVMVVGNYANGEDLSEADLGRMLYFDTSFSANGTMACATCHDPQKGFTDPRVNAGHGMASLGDNGHSFGNRNAPMAAYANTSPKFHYDEKLQEYVGGQFWDGRAASLADQAIGPPVNPIEMGMANPEAVVKRLQANPMYQTAFMRLYGEQIFDKPESADATPPAYLAFGNALQAFEKTEAFASYDSKYDRFLKGEYELTVLEDLGRTLFFSNNNVNCTSCHTLYPEDTEREPFTNHQFRNIGVPPNPELLKLAQLNANYIDHGLLENPAVTDRKYDGKFKTPSLRNVAVTGPYMHNAVFKDLRTVVEFYDHFNNVNRVNNPETGKPWAAPEVPETVDKEDLMGQALSERKVDALVAFLKTLTDRRFEPLLDTGN